MARVAEGANFPCGHPRSPENTRIIASEGTKRCRQCRRRYMRESINRVRREGTRTHISQAGAAACGVRSPRLTLTHDCCAVSCGHCRNTEAFRAALQASTGAEVKA